MARIRTIKPEFFTHPEILRLSVAARLLLISLLGQADDEGRLYDQPLKIQGNAFGEDDEVEIHTLLTELEREGRILRYTSEQRGCVQVVHFTKHQVISHAKPSVIPPPPSKNGRRNVPVTIPEESRKPTVRNGREQGTGKGREGKGKDLKARRVSKKDPNPNQPTHDELYLVEQINARWGKGGNLTIADVVKLNQSYGRPVVENAMRELHGFPPDEAVRSAHAYLAEICRVATQTTTAGAS